MEEQVRSFTNQAVEVAKWDKEIMENGDKIFKLQHEVQRVHVAQKELDQNLEIIYTQQTELHQMLESLESDVANMVNETEMGPTDTEREKGYQLAEDINGQLDQMSNTLKDLISKLNSASEKTEDTDNPVNQIVKILNAHLNSLNWVDENASLLNTKVQEIGRQFAMQQVEQERLSRTSSGGRGSALGWK